MMSIRHHVDLLDEWDALIAYLRDPEGRFKYNKSDLMDYLASAEVEGHERVKLGPEEWLRDWVEPERAFHSKQQPADLEQRVAFLRLWINLATTDQYGRADFERTFQKFCDERSHRASNFKENGRVFIGRNNEMDQIHSFFAAGSSAIALSGSNANEKSKPRQKRGAATLKGFGGQGKTAIAREFARRYGHEYTGVLWIDAVNLDFEAQIAAFVQTQDALRDRVELPAQDHAADRLQSYFEQLATVLRGSILIVLDNVPYEAGDADFNARTKRRVADLLDAVPEEYAVRYNFLITSRRELLPEKILNMPIERLNLQDAVALFKARSGLDTLASDDPRLIELVDDVLGGHALSIVLIAALAREHRISEPAELITRVKNRIVEADAIGVLALDQEDYPKSLYASFRASFTALAKEAQYFLLMLSLFRRDELTVETIRSCVRQMPVGDDGTAVKAIRDDLGRKRGRYPMLNSLVAHSLVERLDLDWRQELDPQTRAILGAESGPPSRGHDMIQIRLHEVIYDFVQAEWAGADAELRPMLDKLEVKLTQGACAYAAKRIEKEQIQFLDIETFTGFLLPIVRPERGILPVRKRVVEALNFWFDYFKFQNFVYDTGLQEPLVEQMENLAAYLTDSGIADERFDLLMKKLIGHAYYANPLGDAGGKAKLLFDDAIEIARRIEDARLYEKQRREIQWYKVFLLDHRSNLASKRRPDAELPEEIWIDAALAADLHEIEATLPASLRSLDGPPTLDECELLVRASIYWGHRGNQDNFILFKRIENGDLGDRWGTIVGDAGHFYTLAANYRLLALKIFRSGEFERRVAKSIRKGLLPHIAPWLTTVPAAPSREYEAFTSFSQAIGDTAHQYRGLHFVHVVTYLGAGTAEERALILAEARRALNAAKLLWDISRKALKPGEVMLKYQLWMASSYAFEAMMETIDRGDAIPPLEEMLALTQKHIDEMQRAEKSNYGFAIQVQKRQLEGIHRKMRDPSDRA